MIEEGVNEMESPRKPVYGQYPGRQVNGVQIPTLDTGDDDRLYNPSPRAPIRTDADVSPLQLTKKDKSKQRQDKLQDEKIAAENGVGSDAQPLKDSDQSNRGEVNYYGGQYFFRASQYCKWQDQNGLNLCMDIYILVLYYSLGYSKQQRRYC